MSRSHRPSLHEIPLPGGLTALHAKRLAEALIAAGPLLSVEKALHQLAATLWPEHELIYSPQFIDRVIRLQALSRPNPLLVTQSLDTMLLILNWYERELPDDADARDPAVLSVALALIVVELAMTLNPRSSMICGVYHNPSALRERYGRCGELARVWSAPASLADRLGPGLANAIAMGLVSPTVTVEDVPMVFSFQADKWFATLDYPGQLCSEAAFDVATAQGIAEHLMTQVMPGAVTA